MYDLETASYYVRSDQTLGDVCHCMLVQCLIWCNSDTSACRDGLAFHEEFNFFLQKNEMCQKLDNCKW